MAYGEIFLRPEHLDALHGSGSASPQTGWQQLDDAGPALYLKSHSWGEFVFDFEIANAYQQSGLDYYPRLVCAVPFTPVTGPRLAGRHPQELMQLMHQHDASSVHVLFAGDEDVADLQAEGWLQRQDMRYVWHDRNYADFEQFLTALSSKKRKNIRAERRAVAALDVEIRWQAAGEFSADQWQRLYQLYASTYEMRGQQPYLNLECLQAWGRALPEAMQFCVARKQDELVAMAFFFRDEEILYGRHWGSAIAADHLHFELCYYRGIEYCLEHDLKMFDAGVQGSHRLLRGFEPQLSNSLHWFEDPRFRRPIARAFKQERRQIQSYFEQAGQHTAYAQK